jgi:hypothetical protein
MPLIHLTKGYVTQVSDEDYDWACFWQWSVLLDTCGNGNNYARRSKRIEGRFLTFMLHNEILARMGFNGSADHINGDTLDNSRPNLRSASRSQNLMNTRKRRNASSRFKGVRWHSQAKRWQARITIGGRTVDLGLFLSEEEGAATYDIAATKYFGAYAKTNRCL